MWPNSSLLKLLYLVLQRATRVQILHPSSLLLFMGLMFLILLPILVNWIQISLYHPANVTIALLSILFHRSQLLSSSYLFIRHSSQFHTSTEFFQVCSEYSADDIRKLSALVTPLFENHRNWEWKEEIIIPSASEQRNHAINGHPPDNSRDTFDTSKPMFTHCKDCCFLNK